MNENNNIPKRYLEAAQKYADHMIGNDPKEHAYLACKEDFLAGARLCHEEILLLKEQFARIERLATDKKDLAGPLLSDSEIIKEIKLNARNCQEYIEANKL